MKKGFTFIEILVVIALIGIISLATSQIFFTVLQSESKGEITKEVKQNGDYALSVIEQMTRNAQDVDISNCNNSGTSFTITNSDGGTTIFDCSTTQISSNSSFLTNTLVDVSSCSVNVVCPTPATSPKYVYINFTLSQHGPTAGVAQNASETYQSTITLRNYK